MNIFQMLGQLKQNPMAMLSRRFKLPQNMNLNNPDEVIQYLMNTGQISQQEYNAKYNQANQIAKMFQH